MKPFHMPYIDLVTLETNMSLGSYMSTLSVDRLYFLVCKSDAGFWIQIVGLS